MKLMLAVLIASFDFGGASPMCGHNLLVTRPYVDNQFSKGQFSPRLLHLDPTDVALNERTPSASCYDSSLNPPSPVEPRGEQGQKN